MNITTVGIDLAKNVFSLHGVDAHGKAVLRKTVSRGKLLECLAQLSPCVVGWRRAAGRTTGRGSLLPWVLTCASSLRAL